MHYVFHHGIYLGGKQAEQPASQPEQNQPVGSRLVSGLDYGATGLGIFEDYISVRKRA